jgi:hypothetical protein
MASKKRTDVVNELATELNPMNEEETMNESVERPLKRRLKLWQTFYPRLSNSTRLHIPTPFGHGFRGHSAMDSEGIRPWIPRAFGHGFRGHSATPTG